jgi:glycosyltransferase involved in cell wall biosynthesis
MTDIVVTAVVPAFHRTEKLRRAVASLLRQDLDPASYEVIVVDSSIDDRRNEEMVREMAAEARCSLRCLTKRPEGPGPSRNLGARSGRGRYIAFMDSDCEAAPEWLREGVAAFEEGVGIVQGRVAPEPGVPHSIFNFYIVVNEESPFYETANMFYRREAFEAGGGFSADLTPTAERPMGGEDVDLAWRVKRLGWGSRFAERAVVVHEVVRQNFRGWLAHKRLYIFPLMVRNNPELRRVCFGRYFYDKPQALLILAAAGLAASFASLWTLLLAVPYLLARAGEPSRTLRGPLRMLRPLIYLPRDVAALAILAAGSLRFRSLLL